jgi:hypothetical protein
MGRTSSVPGAAVRRSTSSVERPAVLSLGSSDGAAVLHPRRPDFLAVDDVPVALAHGGGRDLGRIASGGRLGDRERLEPERAARDAGQVAPLLVLVPVTQHGAHDVHLCVARGRVAARAVDLFEDDARFGDAEPRAVVGFGDEGGEIARVGQGLDECVGIGAFGIEISPITLIERCAQLADRVAQRDLVAGEFEADGFALNDHELTVPVPPSACGRRRGSRDS